MRLWGGKSTYYYFFCKTSYPMVFPLPPSTFFEDHLTPGRGGQAHLRRSPGCCSSHFYDFWMRHNVAPLTGPPKSQARPPISPLNLIPNLSKPLSILPLFLTGPLGPRPTAGHLDSCKSRPVCSLPEQARSRMYLSIRFLYLLLLIFSSISDPNSNYAESPRSGIRKL